MMVIGSLLVIPAICLLMPALALARRPRSADTKARLGRSPHRPLADALASTPCTARPQDRRRHRHRSSPSIASLGVLRLEVETDFTRNFRRGSRVVAAYEFVETHLGGAGVWDVIDSRPRHARRRISGPSPPAARAPAAI